MAKKRTATETVEHTLRRAIVDSGLSLNRIAEDAGISHAQLSRFINHQRTLRSDTFAKVCRVLKLELRSME